MNEGNNLIHYLIICDLKTQPLVLRNRYFQYLNFHKQA
jgi:hypothetical protein